MQDLIDGFIADNGLRLLAYLLTLLATLWAYISVRAGLSQRWIALLQELGGHARDVVQEVWQVYVEAIKAGRADGKLTSEEKAHARELALAKLKTRLGWRKLLAIGGGLLLKWFGGSRWADRLETFLDGALETAVAESKREGKAAGLRTSGTHPLPLPPSDEETTPVRPR